MNQPIKLIFLLFFCISLANCARFPFRSDREVTPLVTVIPKPASIQQGPGEFTIAPGFAMIAESENPEVITLAEAFATRMQQVAGFVVPVKKVKPNQIQNVMVMSLTPMAGDLGPEGYELVVSPEKILVQASSPAGLFYGIQTLYQLLPPEIFSDEQAKERVNWVVPVVRIRDLPRYPYRGMHLDVGRHFFPKEFIKKYIDLIALHKMNTFHWHLTEDQGWRIEIKKYPKLTEISSFRKETLVGHARNQPPQFDGQRYGGYYTREDIKEIVQYAKERYVTIIPEIEMPGHSVAALAAYPQLSCTGGPFEVATTWGVFKDVYCAGNDSVFQFLQEVLTEVIELFPGTYIHIGGDECPKDRWQACPKCQARIKAENLKDEHALQSYFIRRIEKFLLSRGKRLIGWDEILEGGLAPAATVMSWRGVDGGIEAAQQGHDVIMTPHQHCYFNYYQAEPVTEPLAIGGYLTLRKVYSYEPTPAELSGEQEHHVLGAQGCIWTEYIKTPEEVTYMALPRLCALAEVIWSPKQSRNWHDFNSRLQVHFQRLEAMNVNYSKGSYRVTIATDIDENTGGMALVLDSEQYRPAIHYTLDGSDPSKNSPCYEHLIPMQRSTTVKAGIFTQGQLEEKISEKTITVHKAIGKSITITHNYSDRYPAGGARALVDGITGVDNTGNEAWQGYLENDLDATIDLGTIMGITKIATGFMQNSGSWIFMPLKVEYAVSANGRDFTTIAILDNEISDRAKGDLSHRFSQTFAGVQARFVRVQAQNREICPDWHPGAGGKAWLFVDEIIVE